MIEELMGYSLSAGKKSEAERLGIKFINFIDNALEEVNRHKDIKEEGYGGVIEKGFHPSAICKSSCARHLVYEYFLTEEEEEEHGAKLLRIFGNGTSVHDRWQNFFMQVSKKLENFKLLGSYKCKGCGFIYSPDKEVEPPEGIPCEKCGSKRWKYNEFRLRSKELKITGKRDLKFVFEGEKFLGEIKSMNTFQFGKLNTPVGDHLIQFMLYMFLDQEKVRKGFIFYEDKNTQDLKAFYVDYDNEKIAPLIKIVSEASRCVDSMELPERSEGFPNSRTCKLCKFKKVCKEEIKDMTETISRFPEKFQA